MPSSPSTSVIDSSHFTNYFGSAHKHYSAIDPCDGDMMMPSTIPSPEFSWRSPLIRHALASALFLLSSGFAMSFCVTMVHFRMPDPTRYPPLPDFVHSIMPPMRFGAFGEVIYHGGTVMSLIAGLIYCRKNFFPPWNRFFMAWGYSWYLRCIALYATQLPPTTDFNCRFNYPNYPADFPHPIPNIFKNTLLGVVTGGNGNIHCGDLMFSGHTVLLIMNWMFILTYITPHNKVLPVVSTFMSIVKMCFMVLERKHYCIDVLMSMYVSITVWKLTAETIPFWLNWLSWGVWRWCVCLGCWSRTTGKPSVRSSTVTTTALQQQDNNTFSVC
jgi:hypothetical protein